MKNKILKPVSMQDTQKELNDIWNLKMNSWITFFVPPIKISREVAHIPAGMRLLDSMLADGDGMETQPTPKQDRCFENFLKNIL